MYNVNPNIIEFNQNEILSDIEILPEIYSEPFADPSALAVHKLSKFAKEKVKVVFTGDGGDEIFGGYKRHFFYQKIFMNHDC